MNVISLSLIFIQLSANLRHVRVFEMDAEEEEEEEERADESQEMSLDQDRLEDTMTNQSDAGEGGDGVGGAEEAQMAGQGSGDILDETAGSDTLWTLTWDPTCSPQLNYWLLCNSLSCFFCIKNILW